MEDDINGRNDLIDQVIDCFDDKLNNKNIELLRRSLLRVWNHGNNSFTFDFIEVSKKLPEKHKNIIGIKDNYEFQYCYLGTYNEWRCSLTGFELLIDIIKWKYEKI